MDIGNAMIDKGRPNRSFVLAALAWNLILASWRTGERGLIKRQTGSAPTTSRRAEQPVQRFRTSVYC